MHSRSAQNVTTNPVSLTAVELSILDALIQDPHASNREIGESLGLSISQVGTRIRRFEQQHVAHVLAVLDTEAIGQSLAFVFITVRGRPIQEVAQELCGVREIQTITSVILGDFDLILLLRFRTVAHLEALVHDHLAGVRGCSEVMCQIVLRIFRFTHQYMAFSLPGLPPSKRELLSELDYELEPNLVDDLDRDIIAELQADGRSTSQWIARKYDVNPGTVRNRIRSLEARGIMRFVTVVDQQAMGLNASCVVTMDIEASEIQKVFAALTAIESVHYLYSSAGTFKAIGFLIVSDIEMARNIVATQIRSIRGIKSAMMSPLRDIHKMDLRWSSSPRS
jgi:DNA-binding Lrp family transcriptional regulator